jgi:hypothetical protein
MLARCVIYIDHLLLYGVRSKRPSSQPHPHVVACGLGWRRGTRFPGAIQPVCKRHTHTLPPRRVSAVRGR